MAHQNDSTVTHTMILIQESLAIGYHGTVSKGTKQRASVGSNAIIAPRLGSLHTLRRDSSRDVKSVKKSPSHVACGSIPATMTKILESLIKMIVHMIEHDAKHVEKVSAWNPISNPISNVD